MSDIREKFLAVEEELNGEVLERHDEIHGLILATLSKKHIFLLGKPGTAKSFLLDRFTCRIADLGEDGLFKWQLSKTTNDAELFGPFALSKLKEDRFQRITRRKAPRAYFINYDEIFKGSSSIINTNLSILNERVFFNDEEDSHVPLITAMGSSNELPTVAELAALADRLHLWFNVQPIREQSNLVRMMKMELVEKPTQILALDDFYAAQAAVEAVEFPDDLFEVLLNLKEHLEAANIEISDRRLRQSISIAKAEAWLNGHSSVEVYDLKPLQFMFWRQVSDIDPVRKIVLTLTDPLEQKASETLFEFEKAFAEFNNTLLVSEDPHQRNDASIECMKKWKLAKGEWKEFHDEELDLGRRVRAVQALQDTLDKAIAIIVTDGMGLGLEHVKDLVGD